MENSETAIDRVTKKCPYKHHVSPFRFKTAGLTVL